MEILQSLGFLRWPLVLAVAAAFVVLRFRRARTFTWALACWIGIYLVVRHGFKTPIPFSVVEMYMGITTLALAAYVTSSPGRRAEFAAPVVAVATQRRLRPVLIGLLVLLPGLAAGNAYLDTRVTLEAPAFARTVHPAPPDSITVHDSTIDLVHGRNPLRALETTDPQAFATHLENGRRTYYRNCVFCHGDALQGDGMYAHGLNPIPTNFTDKGTIAQLQETFLFWRISKGGPGLPAEGGPWDSAMPAWENFLSEEEIWEVILYVYDATGQRPRAPSAEGEKP
jgi:mono/diheme cytochrome c family protein